MGYELAIVVSLASALGSLWLTRTVILRLPSDYFVNGAAPAASRAAWVARNVGGFLLVLLGLILSIPGVPGQGLLTIAVGLVLIDVPGKRGIERRLLGHPRVLAIVNRVRERAGAQALEAPRDPPA